MQGICQGCGLITKLIDGHSIPDAFIRHARGQGSLTYIPLGGTQKIAGARSTGSHPILCSCCDGKLGNDFDKPVSDWTTGKLSAATDIMDATLAQFLASVFWRASLSEHHYYRNFLGRKHALTIFLKQATYEPAVTFEIASYDVKKMADDAFTNKALESVIIFPFVRVAETNMETPYVFLRAVFGGCIWTMCFPKLQPLSDSLLCPDGKRSAVGFVNLQSDPELRSFVTGAIGKISRGEVSNKLKTASKL